MKDIAGNVSPVRLLTAPGTVTPMSLTISTSLDDSTQSDRVDVAGIYRGPADMVINVNGDVKALTVGNQYCAANVGLDSGINTITVIKRFISERPTQNKILEDIRKYY